MGIYSIRWEVGRSPFQAAGGEFWAGPMGPQPLNIHSESRAQLPRRLQRAPGQWSAHSGRRTQDTGGSRVAWLQLPRLPNFRESNGTALCSLHNNFSASEEQIWGFS